MRLIRQVAGIAAVAALGAVPLANADPSEALSGRYTVSYPDNGKTTTWLFVPCGTDCSIATSQDGGYFVSGWEFHLANGRWTHVGPAQAPCPNGKPAAVNVNYSFDAVSLAGDGSTTTTDACGGEPGKTFTRAFKLTKDG
jgi:hypothetical protein